MIAALLAAAAEFGTTTALPLKGRFTIADTLIVDVDGDGVNDLVLAGRNDERAIQVWLRQKTGRPWTEPDPARSTTVSDDAIAYAWVKNGTAARELLVCTPRALYRHDPSASDQAMRFVRIADADLLWPAADPAGPFHLQAFVHDLDGDGREELVLPEPDAYRVLGRAADGRWSATRLALGEEAESRVLAERAQVRNRGQIAGLRAEAGKARGFAAEILREPWIELEDMLPAPVVADFDGDRKLDIAALTRMRLVWWRQTGPREFDSVRRSETNPVERDRARKLDLSYSARIGDHDGDGRADALVFAANRRSEKAQTQVLSWLGAKAPQEGPQPRPCLFPANGTPGQVLVLDGIARAIAHEDVDGDKLPDLVAGAIKPDLIDALRAATSERIDAQIYVFLNKRGTYSKRPDLAWTVSIKAARFEAQVEVVGDLSGDGLAEFLVRSEPEKARILMTRKGRDGTLSLLEQPLWEGVVDPEARLLAPAKLDKSSPDLHWIGKDAVSCTSFY